MCDQRQCAQKNVDADIFCNMVLTTEEFLTQFYHLRCKVIQLAHDQLQKCNSKQKTTLHKEAYEHNNDEDDIHASHVLSSTHHDLKSGQWHARMGPINETTFPYLSKGNIKQEKPSTLNVSSLLEQSTWVQSILPHLSLKKKTICTCLIIGLVVWISLAYGAILGTAFCGKSHFCYSKSSKHIHKQLF